MTEHKTRYISRKQGQIRYTVSQKCLGTPCASSSNKSCYQD